MWGINSSEIFTALFVGLVFVSIPYILEYGFKKIREEESLKMGMEPPDVPSIFDRKFWPFS